MAKYFSIRNSTQSPFSVPLKLQAETIRNDGTEDIFILGPEDDEPVNQASLLVYSVAIVRPGQGVDVANSPYVNMYAKNGIDKFVTLHAAQTIKAGIVSNDAPEDWENDPKHFWNGQPFPNGSYTNRFGKLKAQAQAGTPAINPNHGLHFGGTSHVVVPGSTKWIDIYNYNIEVPKGTTKCTCGISSLHGGGRHSNWCDLPK
jgi:hypothetical protein